MPATTPMCTNQSVAYQRLRDDIVHCRLKPGQKLSAKALEEELGVGRTPIRESLVRLNELGIVYTVPQSGTFVSKIDMDRAESARYMREHLEKRVAVESCALVDNEQLKQVCQLIEDQETAICEDDAEKFFNLDNAFHEFFFTVAGRHDVWVWVNAFNVDLERYRWLRNQVQELDWGIIMEQHRQIYRALAARDTDEMSYASTAHLHLMIDEQEAVVDAFPNYFKNVTQKRESLMS